MDALSIKFSYKFFGSRYYFNVIPQVPYGIKYWLMNGRTSENSFLILVLLEILACNIGDTC